MKNIKYLFISIFLICTVTISGCSLEYKSNKELSPRPYTYATILLPDGTVISGELNDYIFLSDGRCGVIIDGTKYLTHINNTVLMAEEIEENYEDD